VPNGIPQSSRAKPGCRAPARLFANSYDVLVSLSAAMRVLVVDDEPALRSAVQRALALERYDVALAEDGRQALDRIAAEELDAVVLDVAMPHLDGLEVCRRMRARSSVPIIMLTAKAEEIDKVLGLELGADDYITKPFSLREFRSRVKAALRRAGMARREPSGDEGPLEVHELRIDPAKRAVEVRGALVQTTYVEFEILVALATSPGRVWTRDMLLTRIWGDSAYRDPRTIDVHIRHLREKLERDAKDPEYLFTVRGVGYRFRDTEG
jgi:DNA-binding response OmpR family regulator